MNKWELTESEIWEAFKCGKKDKFCESVAQAAQKKMVEWQDKRNKSEVGKLVLSALDWQELRKGVGL